VILVGTGEPGYAVNLFGPDRVTVATGTTVTFRNPWFEPHTVTFPGQNPVPPPSDPQAPVPTHPGQTVAYNGTDFVNSGFFFRGQDFRISFPNTGSFTFLCIIHPGMAGTVTAVAPGSAGISTQPQLDAAAAATFAPALTALKAEASRLAAKPVNQVRNADGTTTWRVATVGGFVAPSDVQQFFPSPMNIRAGDTVVWESSVPTPHTVTFLGGTTLGGPPTPENPRVFGPTPAPATGYTGVGYVNSGVIGLGWPVGQTFSVKFSQAGNFPYICVLHAEQGMAGTINVAAGAPAPPTTGSAGLASMQLPAAAMGALASLALVLTLLARRASRRAR
jgi:plastocyanin